ncbi:MAG: bifunctional 5,10-methylenetetrahydrofolate dehydrogenase/5,10-methenyltetrahydrofolate cyclohydrolase, partial [Candidatus ainarchaeum sp.]|nr:bifunctional 5,10-methylenetetrahydrofolate dehydrogenase/5,10-methenyltetrahydrofolate cyclohydrolase [Candidatus ainarchaeum sp.]
MLLNGTALAESIVEKIKAEAKRMKVRPKLAIVLVGDDQPSQIYVRKKIETAKKAGMDAELFHLPQDVDEKEVLALVERLNADKRVDGFIVQLPLPGHIDADRVTEHIKPEKDVDGLHSVNIGKVLLNNEEDAFAPATPAGIIMLLEHYKVRLKGANAVVVGRSSIVGKPMAAMLLNRDATVTICHSRTRNLAEFTKKADVLVVAVGKPGLIKPAMVKQGAYVVDAGTTRMGGKTMGDVDSEVQ